MTKPHMITRDELIAYIEAERWERYTSSASRWRGSKYLEFSNRRQFRVIADGEPIYSGYSLTEAVNAYNEAG